MDFIWAVTGASHFRFTVRVLDPRDGAVKKQVAGTKPEQSAGNGADRWREIVPGGHAPRPAAFGRQESGVQGVGEAGGSQRPMGTFRTGMPVNVTTPAQKEGRMITHWFPQRG